MDNLINILSVNLEEISQCTFVLLQTSCTVPPENQPACPRCNQTRTLPFITICLKCTHRYLLSRKVNILKTSNTTKILNSKYYPQQFKQMNTMFVYTCLDLSITPFQMNFRVKVCTFFLKLRCWSRRLACTICGGVHKLSGPLLTQAFFFLSFFLLSSRQGHKKIGTVVPLVLRKV